MESDPEAAITFMSDRFALAVENSPPRYSGGKPFNPPHAGYQQQETDHPSLLLPRSHDNKSNCHYNCPTMTFKHRDFNSVLGLLSLFFIFGCRTDSFNLPIIDPDSRPIESSSALFDPLAPLYPDTDILYGRNSFESDVPRGSQASVALMVSTPVNEDKIKITAAGPEHSVELFELLDIPVYENTGFFGMTEQNLGFYNKNVVRNAPFRIYEVLLPSLRKEFSGKTRYAFLLKLPVSDEAPAGPIPIRIEVRTAPEKPAEVLEWTVNVHPVLAPVGEGSELLYTNWFRGPQEGFSNRFDGDWWRMMEDHIRFMRSGGQNVIKVPNAVVFDGIDSGEPVLNAERLERFLSLCEEYDFLRFEGSPTAIRKTGHRRRGVLVKFGRSETGTAEAEKSLKQAYSQLYEFLEERGSTDVWLQHILDEPLEKHAGPYQWIAAELDEIMPGVRIVEATKARRPLAGAVDVWAPLVSDYQHHREFFTERQSLGEEVWIYSCMVPGGAWLNRTMDQERLRSVYIGWGCSLFDVTGYLRWDLDSWRDDQDIWEGELSGSPDKLIRRPFGDGFATFPDGEGGLLSTTRWEAGRVGTEDYRLLQLLKERNPKEHRRIIALCFEDFKRYETDPSIYRNAKKQLLSALSATN